MRHLIFNLSFILAINSLASTTLTLGKHQNVFLQIEKKKIKNKNVLVLSYKDSKNHLFKRAIEEQTYSKLLDDFKKIKTDYIIAPYKPCGDVAVLNIENESTKLCFDNISVAKKTSFRKWFKEITKLLAL